MDKHTIYEFLKEVDRICLNSEAEETFNVISVLKNGSDERYLHSRFIASVLDPKAPNGHSDSFLKLFLNTINSNFLDKFDYSRIQIQPNYRSSSENDNIDIFIHDGNYAIIIENKINAKDTLRRLQNEDEDVAQLEYYYRKKSPGNKDTEAYYLNIFGEQPSNFNITDGKDYYEYLRNKLKILSYKKDILQWIEKCLGKTTNSEPIYSALTQYKRIVMKITGDSPSETKIQELMEVISKHISSCKYLTETIVHVEWWTIYYFWKELTEALMENGYKIYSEIEKDNSERKEWNIKNEQIDKFVHGSAQAHNKAEMTLKMTKGQLPDIIIEAPSSGPLTINDRVFDQDLCLDDFSKETTFNLISTEARKKTIKGIVEKVLETLYDYPQSYPL